MCVVLPCCMHAVLFVFFFVLYEIFLACVVFVLYARFKYILKTGKKMMCCIAVLYFFLWNFCLIYFRVWNALWYCKFLCHIFPRVECAMVFCKLVLYFPRIERALVLWDFMLYFYACWMRSGIVKFWVIFFCMWNALWYCGILCHIFPRVERALLL